MSAAGPEKRFPKQRFPLKDGNQGTAPTRRTLRLASRRSVRVRPVPSELLWFPNAGTDTEGPDRRLLEKALQGVDQLEVRPRCREERCKGDQCTELRVQRRVPRRLGRLLSRDRLPAHEVVLRCISRDLTSSLLLLEPGSDLLPMPETPRNDDGRAQVFDRILPGPTMLSHPRCDPGFDQFGGCEIRHMGALVAADLSLPRGQRAGKTAGPSGGGAQAGRSEARGRPDD